MSTQSISLVVITKNEESNIGSCLDAAASLCDEMLVYDSHSEDKTVAIAREKGAVVIEGEWLGYAETKNLAMQEARNEWVLSLDADELLSKELADSIGNLKKESGTAYELDRLTFYAGKPVRHSGWYPDWKIRLFEKSRVFWEGAYVHEKICLPPGHRLERLQGKLFHYSYDSRDQHLQRMDKYARLSARKMAEEGKSFSMLKMYLSPAWRFFRTLVLKGGILDGKLGWLIARRNALMVYRKYRYLRKMRDERREM